MRPAPAFFASGAAPAVHVGSLAYNIQTDPQAVTFPSGTKAGDLAIIMVWEGFPVTTTSITGGAGGWTRVPLTWTSPGYQSAIFWKVLASGDLGGVSIDSSTSTTNYTAIVSVYRGPTTVSIKSTSNPQDDTLPLAGFTKAAGCRGIVTIAQDRDPSSNPTAPTGFTMRAGPGNFGYFTGSAADMLSIANYANGSTVTWTDFIGATGQVGWLLELT